LGLVLTLLSLLTGLWLVFWPRPVTPGGQTQGVAPLRPSERAAEPGSRVELGAVTNGGPVEPGGAAEAAVVSNGRVAVLSAGTGLRLAGLVLAADDGQPIAGVRARLVAGEQELVGQTDAAGRFSLLWPHGSKADLELAHPEFDRLAIPDFDATREAPFLMQRAGSLAGEVHWSGVGDSVGLLVEVWPMGFGNQLGEPIASVRTGERGQFLIPHQRTGEYVVTARADDEVRGPSPLAVHAGVRVQAGQRQYLRMELHPGANLEVEIVREGGGPLAGLQARAEYQGSGVDKDKLQRRTGITAGSGRVLLKGLPEGQVTVRITGPLGERQERVVGLQAKGHFERFEIAAPVRLTGRVLDVDRQPVAGALVGVAVTQENSSLGFGELQSPERGYAQVTTSAADGSFGFSALPARNDLWLVAYPPEMLDGASPGPRFPGTLFLQGPTLLGDRQGVELFLLAGRSVAGHVRTPEGVALAGAKVWARFDQNGVRQNAEAVLSDSAGAFSLPVVRDRNVNIMAELEGFQFFGQRLDDGRTAITDLSLVLVPTTMLSGRVVDTSNAAVVDARLTLRRKSGRRTEMTTSDAFGRFVFANGPSGTWDLRVEADGFRLLTLPLELPLVEPQVLVLESEQELPKASLSGECLAGWSPDPVAGLTISGLGQASFELRAGRFFITGVQPGRLRLVAHALGCESLAWPPIEVAAGANMDLGTLRLFKAATLKLDIQGYSGNAEISARLVPLSRELGGVGVERKPIEMEGDFTFRAAQAAWQLRVEVDGYAPYGERIELSQSNSKHRVQLVAAPQ
jgi:Carboxypeptidase regulatory-like domain